MLARRVPRPGSGIRPRLRTVQSPVNRPEQRHEFGDMDAAVSDHEEVCRAPRDAISAVEIGERLAVRVFRLLLRIVVLAHGCFRSFDYATDAPGL